MMTRYFTIIMIITAALITFQCTKKSTDPERTPPRALTAGETRIVDADNSFGFNIFREVVLNNPDSNIFISPLSIAMALGMTYNGAEGTTREAMDSVLQLNGMDIQEVNESYQSLINLLVNLDPEVTFQIANSIWYREDFPFSQDFIELNRTYFYAEVDALDFNDPNAAVIINDWVYDNTNGKIEEIVQPPIPHYIVMFLINAIYFNGNWTDPFDPEDTHDALFTLPDSSQSACQMMFQENDIQYYANDQFQAIDLPYGDGLYSMTVLLPRPAIDINALIAGLNQGNWIDYIDGLSGNTLYLFLPKFKLEYEDSLKDDLTALGMGIAFDIYQADFGGMLDPASGIERGLFINEVRHKTFIRVDEVGTEAAAVTSVEIGFTSAPPAVYINRPFLFMIRENHSGTILFMGKIIRPDWE
ncbi:MAG: serpin family protein [candidate division Zixibacteria bacterium]|nr:serpin family protein [candidate division Zixibacteria bacterium]